MPPRISQGRAGQVVGMWRAGQKQKDIGRHLTLLKDASGNCLQADSALSRKTTCATRRQYWSSSEDYRRRRPPVVPDVPPEEDYVSICLKGQVASAHPYPGLQGNSQQETAQSRFTGKTTCQEASADQRPEAAASGMDSPASASPAPSLETCPLLR